MHLDVIFVMLYNQSLWNHVIFILSVMITANIYGALTIKLMELIQLLSHFINEEIENKGI